MTVGELREQIRALPDDYKVCIQVPDPDDYELVGVLETWSTQHGSLGSVFVIVPADR